jgi:hypothetical protein
MITPEKSDIAKPALPDDIQALLPGCGQPGTGENLSESLSKYLLQIQKQAEEALELTRQSYLVSIKGPSECIFGIKRT